MKPMDLDQDRGLIEFLCEKILYPHFLALVQHDWKIVDLDVKNQMKPMDLDQDEV